VTQETNNKPTHDHKGKFAKGNNANPGGRPKGSGVRARLRALAIQEYSKDADGNVITYQDALAHAIYHAAIDDRDTAAMKLAVESIDGKLPLTIQHTTDDPRKMELSQIGEILDHMKSRALPEPSIDVEFTVRKETDNDHVDAGGDVGSDDVHRPEVPG